MRKLVIDLNSDISKLDAEEAKRVEVATLHRLARSIVERNGGTRAHPFAPYIKIVGPRLEEMVWGDVLSLAGDGVSAALDDFKGFFYDLEEPQTEPWVAVRDAYFRLSHFYNAVGFGDLIVHAATAMSGNRSLIEHDLWIFDEFQDFNRTEEWLIQACTDRSGGVVLAGDDDQALYQKLKASHPEIIRGYWGDGKFCRAMLPFCSRCDFHIAMAASSFLKSHKEQSSLAKIFLSRAIRRFA